MELRRLLDPLDEELERRDQRLDFLKRQLSGSYDREDYVRADRVSNDIAKARAERERFRQSRDALAIMIDAIAPPIAEA